MTQPIASGMKVVNRPAPPGASKPNSSAGAAIKPLLNPDLVCTQLNANFGKVPGEQPNVIDLIRQCHQANGGGEIAAPLNDIIDGLARKVQAECGQDAREIKLIVLKFLDQAEITPRPTEQRTRVRFKEEIESEPTPTSKSTPTSASTPAAQSTTTEVDEPAEEASRTVPSSSSSSSVSTPGLWSYLQGFFRGESRQQTALRDIQQVAIKSGVADQLILHKKELEHAQRQETLNQKIAEVNDQVKALPDLDAFQTALAEAEACTKSLAENTHALKKSLVDQVRRADLLNRNRVKLATDRSETRKASHHTKLQSEIAESVQKTVEPLLQPEVELNSARVNALSERIAALEELERAKLPELQARAQEANNAREFDQLNALLHQLSACEKHIDALKDQKSKLEELQDINSASAVDLKAIRELDLQFGVTGSRADALPFSLHMLGNGVKSVSVSEGFSLNQALEYGRSGRSNKAMSRAIALRTHLAEFGSDFNVFENAKNPAVDTIRGDRRSSLVDLGGALRNPAGERAEKVLDFLSTEKGRKYVHRLAACNVSAAGFNAKTLRLDAPSLAYKIESGFGVLKKLMVGRTGVYARDPAEYLGKRLSVLGRLSATLQNELFREGKPVRFEHALITPQHAVEAASLLLAALPNDLLTVNHEDVTRFMRSVKAFEDEILTAEYEERPVHAEMQLEIKQVLREFHSQSASWLARRNAHGADESSLSARRISEDIAAIRNRGVLRKASSSVGSFINLCGGAVVREGWSAFNHYLMMVNQKERLRQQFDKPENAAAIASLKYQLQSLADSGNELDADNARALVKFLNATTMTVEMKGQLSSSLKRILLSMGDFLQNAWEPVSKDQAPPRVIGLSPNQIRGMANYASTNLSKFAWNVNTEAPVQLAGSVSPSVSVNTPPRDGSTMPVASNEQWISDLWGDVLIERPGSNFPLARLKSDYLEFFAANSEAGKNLESLDEIAVFAGKNLREIPYSAFEKMRQFTPALIKIRRGGVLQSQLAPLQSRTLQDVSGNLNRCWLRASWGAAVNALSKEDFVRRVVGVAASMKTELGTLWPSANEIGEIYDQVKRDPANGMQNKASLEYKQRALMIKLMEKAEAGWRQGKTLDTLMKLKNAENPQTEGDFGILLLNALGMPLIIHRGSDAIPDVYLPDNFQMSQHGHPDTWPTLRYDGNGESGHWQFYPKPASTG